MCRLALALAVLTLSPAVAAQDWRAMSDEERRAYFADLQRQAEADRQRTMALVGVAEVEGLPSWADDPNRPTYLVPREGTVNWYDEAGNVHVRSGWGRWSNYDEAEAGGWPVALDPLVTLGGERVTTPDAWWDIRRPEIVESYLNALYGPVPPMAPAFRFDPVGPDSVLAEGTRIRRVVGRVEDARYGVEEEPRIEMKLYLPDGAENVPVVVRVGGFWGAEGETPEPVQMALDRGWAFVTVNPGAIQQDSGAGLDAGVIGLTNRGEPRSADDWGVLAAWAWGTSRTLDYFRTIPEIDATQAAVQGHSRYGKTALLAAAMDPRWAAAFPSCSGAMGASLEKRDWGETIDNVASGGGYHWMTGNFMKYAGDWDAMPGDAHFLIALVAPRPLFITGGTEDQWSDPHGEFLAAVAASPVYELLGADGLRTVVMPRPDEALMSGELVFRNHDGGHTDAPDWPVFYEWVAPYFDSESP